MRSSLAPLSLAPVTAQARTGALALALAVLTSAPAAATGPVLLIPNSGSDKVWAVSPVDGSIISQSFIPNTEGWLQQPIQAIPSGTGTILVTDETKKSVFEYSPTGAYLRTLAGPATGAAGAFGICVRDGMVYFTSGSGISTTAGVIYRVPLAGGNVTVFSDWTTVGAPRAIVPFGDGFLVGNSTFDNLEIVDANGVVAPVPFHDSNGSTGINFPQQIRKLEKGQILGSSWLVAGFSSPYGLFLYDSTGISYGYYATATSPRGCYVLPNGDILFTAGTQIRKIDALNNNSVVVYEGGSSASFRWIDVYTPPSCTADVDGNGVVNATDLGAVLAAWGGSNAAADVNGSGTVDAADLAIVLAGWGPC